MINQTNFVIIFVKRKAQISHEFGHALLGHDSLEENLESGVLAEVEAIHFAGRVTGISGIKQVALCGPELIFNYLTNPLGVIKYLSGLDKGDVERVINEAKSDEFFSKNK